MVNSNKSYNQELRTNESEAPHTEDRQGPLCVLCYKVANFNCARCSDPYCSHECQRIDWRRHRFICSAMPPLEAISGNVLAQMRLNRTQTIANNENGSISDITSSSDAQSNSSFNTTVSTELSALQNCKIIIMSFRSNNRCVIRSASTEDREEYDAILKKIASFGVNAPPLTKMSRYALAEYNGVVRRVNIIPPHRNKNIQVYFPDLGLISYRNISELKQMPDEVLKMKQLTYVVQLLKVPHFSYADNWKAVFKPFLNEEWKLRCKKSDKHGGNVVLYNEKGCLNQKILEEFKRRWQRGGDDKVVLRDTVDPDENNDTLNDLNITENVDEMQAEPNEVASDIVSDIAAAKDPAITSNEVLDEKEEKTTTNAESLKSSVNAPFETLIFEKGAKNILAIVLDNSCVDMNFIGCIAKSDLQHLCGVQTFLAKSVEKHSPYKPKLGEYCIAKFEDGWYRAKVCGINEDKFSVIYSDFTNEGQVTSADIRAYPTELTIACKTTLCLLSGIPEDIPQSIKNFLLDELAVQSKIVIDNVIDVKDGIALIECKELINKLLEKGMPKV